LIHGLSHLGHLLGHCLLLWIELLQSVFKERKEAKTDQRVGWDIFIEAIIGNNLISLIVTISKKFPGCLM
jgi:hypothetical protein